MVSIHAQFLGLARGAEDPCASQDGQLHVTGAV